MRHGEMPSGLIYKHGCVPPGATFAEISARWSIIASVLQAGG